MTESQQAKLARPFAANLVKPPPQGKFGNHVPHHTVTQKLLAVVPNHDLEKVDLIYDEPYHWTWHEKDQQNNRTGKTEPRQITHCLTGVLYRLTIRWDNGTVTITEEGGEVENPENASTNGARLKLAISDSVKRMAMRRGGGLHLWAQDSYFLYQYLTDDDAAEVKAAAAPDHDPDTPAVRDQTEAAEVIRDAVRPNPLPPDDSPPADNQANAAAVAGIKAARSGADPVPDLAVRDMTVKELKAELDQAGVSYFSTDRKVQLADRLVGHRNSSVSSSDANPEAPVGPEPAADTPTPAVDPEIDLQDIHTELDRNPSDSLWEAADWRGAFLHVWLQLTDGERMTTGTFIRTRGFALPDHAPITTLDLESWNKGTGRYCTGHILKTLETRP